MRAANSRHYGGDGGFCVGAALAASRRDSTKHVGGYGEYEAVYEFALPLIGTDAWFCRDGQGPPLRRSH